MLELYMPWLGIQITDVRTIYAMDFGIQMLEL